jgi:hypothetical protein
LNYIGRRAPPDDVADIGWRYWLKYIGWRAIFGHLTQKTADFCGFEGDFSRFLGKITTAVRKKIKQFQALILYINKYHDLYIYITP